MPERLTPDRSIRLLRAKASELENRLRINAHPNAVDYVAADLGLIAGLLADHIERTQNHELDIAAHEQWASAHIENLIERVYRIEEVLELNGDDEPVDVQVKDGLL